MKHNKHYQGFTLIELMIVIVILGLLVGTIIPRITGGQGRSIDAKRITDLTEIARALELYKIDNGSYPTVNASGAYDPTMSERCLNAASPAYAALAPYFKSGRLPTPEAGGVRVFHCYGAYYYYYFNNQLWPPPGPNYQQYVLATTTRDWRSANFDIAGNQLYIGGAIDWQHPVSYASILGPLSTEAVDGPDASFYLIVGGK